MGAAVRHGAAVVGHRHQFGHRHPARQSWRRRASYALLVAQSDAAFGPQHDRFGSIETGYGMVGSAVLAVPPLVLGAGWFLAMRGWPAQTLIAGFLVMLVNALMALPFVLRIMSPAFQASERRYGALSASLGLSGLHRFARVDAPVMARPFAVALAFALVLSVGDLGAAALFGAYDLVTLPVLILNLMGSYRTDDAAGVACCSGFLSLCSSRWPNEHTRYWDD
jgi:thiamine transport system permease protein